jgi:cyclopropane fatty-acyl-phospholipid synthase-like methyltransferase
VFERIRVLFNRFEVWVGRHWRPIVAIFFLYVFFSQYISLGLARRLPPNVAAFFDLLPISWEGFVRLAIVVFVVSLISFAKEKRRRYAGRLWGQTKDFMLNHPAMTFFPFMGLGIALYFLPSWAPIVVGGLASLCTVASGVDCSLAPSQAVAMPSASTSHSEGPNHFINVLGFVGTIFSGLGFFYTFLQLRDNSSRIVGYRAFYRQVRKLFDEIAEGEATEFYFYGPTILPGNVAISESEDGDVRRFKESLDDLYRKRERFDKASRAIIIVPPVNKYKVTYAPYLRMRMSHTLGKDPKEWLDFVRRKAAEAAKVQSDLSTDHFQKWAPRQLRDIATSYFVSNGKRIIYVKPLHYVSARASRDDERVSPHLVGFTSMDSVTVDAFQEYFEKLYTTDTESIERPDSRYLRAMYGKHVVTPDYLDECLMDLPSVSVEDLAEYDHDHFGKKEATNRFITECKIQRGDYILDIGSGFGGPARYVAEKCGCSVHGIELQADRYKWAEDITALLGSNGGRVTLSNRNASQEIDQVGRTFNHAMAFLSILHFPDKEDFLKKLGHSIETGGKVYIEDYIRVRKLESNEQDALRDFLSCPSLLMEKEYLDSLALGGLHQVSCVDTTDEWRKIAKQRVDDFAKDELKYDPDVFMHAQAFHQKVVELFESGVIEGRRIVVEKKSSPPRVEGKRKKLEEPV